MANNQGKLTEAARPGADNRLLCLQTKDEMWRMSVEIEDIEASLRANANAMKQVQTRLENRCRRPGMELCIDDVYSGLCDELKRLNGTQHQLNDKLMASKAALNALEANLRRLEDDLKRKQHTLMTDIRALDLRQRLRAENAIKNDRGVALTQLNDQLVQY